MTTTTTCRRSRRPATDDADWGLPGNRITRRARLYAVAARVGFRYAALRRPGGPQGAERAEAMERAHRLGARDLYRAAVDLRGGFLKMGQFVSSRPDLLPEAYVEELSKLQDRVPPAPAAVIERIVTEQIGPIDEHFAEFDRHEASAASLAQVHRAVRLDGRAVAVKVQYPRVPQIVPGEMRDTRRMLEGIGLVVKGVGLSTIAEALEASILDELDYGKEAANIERFADNFADEPGIVVPRVHHDLSGPRVLVMDWVEGQNLGQALRESPEIADRALRLLMDSYMKQILVDGFLHADPHPGNFLLRTTDGGLELGIVDFGACSTLSPTAHAAIRDAYGAGLRMDLTGVVDALERLGLRTRSGQTRNLLAWGALFTSDPGLDETRQKAWRRLITAARTDPIAHIPPELVMLGRVLIVQSGLLGTHAPSWSLDELIATRLGVEVEDDAQTRRRARRAARRAEVPAWVRALPSRSDLASVATTSDHQLASCDAEIAFDPTDPDFIRDPYPRYQELREDPFLHRTVEGSFVFTRHDDVRAALRDNRLSSDPRHMTEIDSDDRGLLAPMFGGDGPGILLFMDPPDHTRLRRLVSKAFTPRSVEALRPHVTDLVEDMLAPVADGEGFDLMSQLAVPLPVIVICELLGVPEADRDRFGNWSTALARMLDPVQDPLTLRRAVPASIGMIEYFNDLIDERRGQPQDDLLSALVQAESEGDRLTHAEMVSLVILLFVAGHETTTNLIGNGTLALLRHPDQYQRLVAEPSMARTAVEELLRYDSPVQMTARTATCDLDLNGTPIPQGQTIMLGLAAANRDDQVWADADRLIVDRDGESPLSFGYGIHYCLGAGLARLEGQVVFEALARKLPGLTLTADQPPYREHFVLRGVDRLDVTC